MNLSFYEKFNFIIKILILKDSILRLITLRYKMTVRSPLFGKPVGSHTQQIDWKENESIFWFIYDKILFFAQNQLSNRKIVWGYLLVDTHWWYTWLRVLSTTSPFQHKKTSQFLVAISWSDGLSPCGVIQYQIAAWYDAVGSFDTSSGLFTRSAPIAFPAAS